MTLRLHIERVVVDGLALDAQQAPGVATGLQEALAAMLTSAAPESLRGSGEWPLLRVERVVDAPLDGSGTGRWIAGVLVDAIAASASKGGHR